jgi:hypothetical protein
VKDGIIYIACWLRDSHIQRRAMTKPTDLMFFETDFYVTNSIVE